MQKQKQFSALKRAVNDFLEFCEIGKNQSRNTVENYSRFLGRLVRFAESAGVTKPEQISLDFVKRYRLFLNRLETPDGRPLKMVTQNFHLIALRAFLKYLRKMDHETLAPEKVELPKNPARQVEFLEQDELERLFKATEQEDDEILRLRDRAILELLFSTGLRVSELCHLKKNNVNLDRGEFTVRGKGDKLRIVFISPEASKAVRQYLKKRTDASQALFVAHSTVGTGGIEREIESQGYKKGERDEEKQTNAGLTPRSVQRTVKKYCQVAGIVKKVSPHTLRHSFATDLLQNGADIRSVQSLLGHASITTTQLYTHVTNKGLREIHERFHGKK